MAPLPNSPSTSSRLSPSISTSSRARLRFEIWLMGCCRAAAASSQRALISRPRARGTRISRNELQGDGPGVHRHAGQQQGQHQRQVAHRDHHQERHHPHGEGDVGLGDLGQLGQEGGPGRGADQQQPDLQRRLHAESPGRGGRPPPAPGRSWPPGPSPPGGRSSRAGAIWATVRLRPMLNMLVTTKSSVKTLDRALSSSAMRCRLPFTRSTDLVAPEARPHGAKTVAQSFLRLITVQPWALARSRAASAPAV